MTAPTRRQFFTLAGTLATSVIYGLGESKPVRPIQVWRGDRYQPVRMRDIKKGEVFFFEDESQEPNEKGERDPKWIVAECDGYTEPDGYGGIEARFLEGVRA